MSHINVSLGQEGIRAAHHQIGNSLQSVASLLLLQGRSADPAAAKVLFDASRRVRVIMRLHERLQARNNDEVVSVDALIGDICRDIGEIDGTNGETRLVLDLERFQASASLATAIGLIVAELTSNALEHGLNWGDGVCEVTLGRHFSGYRLQVADDGSGFPLIEDPLARGGFGLSLIKRLVHQIGGTISCVRLDPGTRFDILIP